jgi:hypothetical protein
MPEIGFRESEEFKGLDGQSVPKKDLLEGVFRQARFDTRFYEEVERSQADDSPKGDAYYESHSYMWTLTQRLRPSTFPCLLVFLLCTLGGKNSSPT